ncbi:MAG: NifU family protein [Nocardioidaceae bacterium]
MTDLRATGERIDALLDAAGAGGVVARERAEELVRLVSELYGAGLERVLELLHESGRLDDELLDLLAADDLVAGLLIVHGLHPDGVEVRVARALDRVRPYLGSHGGDVELLAVTAEGTVRLRLLGSCDGCPSSSVTLKLAVEDAIEAAAPEITAIEVEEPTGRATPGGQDTVIPVDSLRTRLDHQASSSPGARIGVTWHTLPTGADLAAGETTQVTAGGSTLLLARVGSDLFAFADRCPRCGAGLAGAGLARRLGGAAGDAVLTCASCRAHFDVRRAGACIDVPDLHLDPFPLLADGSGVSVALPNGVPA